MPDITKARVLFALEKMPDAVRSDALKDGSVIKRFNIQVHSPVRIGSLTINRVDLFDRFRQVANGGTPTPLLDIEGAKIEVKVSFDKSDSGVVQVGDTAFRFPHAGLLASDVAVRRERAERAIARATLTAPSERRLRELAAGSLHDEAFIDAVGILSDAPEAFARSLKETLKNANGNIGEADLLPDHVWHWENLTAALNTSVSLQSFVDTELAAERQRHLNIDAVRAYRTISLSFCAPALVPKQMLDSLSIDTVIGLLEDILKFDDPFALVGSFEYCAASLERDARFAAMGEKILQRLVADMDRLRRAAGMWATAFVIATGNLAMNDRTRFRPAFWRRLAAVTHASLVVRACGVHDADPTEILQWAIHLRGHEYQFSVYSDMAVEPRWRPEWADPSILTADIFGRAYGAFRNISEGKAPPTWGPLLERGKAWIDEEKITLFLMYPSVLEGAVMRAAPPIDKMDPPLAGVFRRFIADPTIDNFISAGAASQTFGVPSEIIPAVGEGLKRIRQGSANLDDPTLRTVMGMAAHLAVMTSDASLADLVIQTTLDTVRDVTHRQAVNEAVSRVLEASRALADPTTRQTVLCQGLLALSNIFSPNLLGDLVECLEALVSINPELAVPLGRTIHVARLGMPSSVVLKSN